MHGKLKKLRNCWWLDYGIVVTIGIVAFTLIYGLKIVSPTYTDWLLSGGDLTQEYLGWKAFRADDWRFPLGLISNLSYPNEVSVIYTDPIPCLALVFKTIRDFLPTEFQYLGMWGIACFILTGIFAYRIISKFAEHRLHRILCASILIFSPTIIWKMYGHTPLGGQWIILFAIDSCLTFNIDKKFKEMCIKAIVLGFLGVSVHMYFLLMSGIVLAGEAVYIILCEKKCKKSIMIIGLYCVIGLLTLYLLGGFYGGVSAAGGGLGIFSYNLNSLINPQGFSKLFKDMPLYGTGQYEGMAYIGAGVIFLSLVAVAFLLSSEAKKQKLLTYWKEIISVLFVLLIAYIVAASNILTINDKVIAEIKLPSIIYKLWSVFRASGRVSWIISYIVIIGVLTYVSKNVKSKKVVTALLSICFIIQIYDLSDVILYKNSIFNTMVKVESSVNDDNIAINYFSDKEEIRHVVLVESWYEVDMQDIYDITDWALDNEWTVSTFYFARNIDAEVSESLKASFENPNSNEIFICRKAASIKCINNELHWYNAGKYMLGYVSKVKKLKEVSPYPNYEIGSDIILYNSDSYNGNQYVESGISVRENIFSWTNSPEMKVAFKTSSKVQELHGQVDIANVYTGTQKVKIYVNKQEVFDSVVSANQKVIDFKFDNPGPGKAIEILFVFPECNSPANRGESQDERMLSLGITAMRFKE